MMRNKQYKLHVPSSNQGPKTGEEGKDKKRFSRFFSLYKTAPKPHWRHLQVVSLSSSPRPSATMKFSVLSGVVANALSVSAGTILWDGRFNDFASATDLNNWSWGNQVGPYQYYIHGSSPVTSYVNLSPSYKNPADTGSKQGAKITLDNTAYWNGQNMRRTELIPQTTAAITKGKVFYHFSLMRKDTNAPAITREHQIAFFESHFTELKSGWQSGASGISDPLLRWCVGGQTKWSVNWDADVWHNVAYEIDFSANTVAFWHSTGGAPLTRKVAAVATSTSSNGADWHVGVLELPRSGYPDADEDFYWSGVYIESGDITTNVAGPGMFTYLVVPIPPLTRSRCCPR
jgi:hypothetical protein